MTTYTPAQLEAWAGLGPWRVHPGANSHLFDGTIVDQSDSALAFVHACLFQDEDNGVYGATVSRSGELMVAAPDLARLVLEKDAEIARLKAKLSQTPTAEWFYNPDDWEYSYESPRHVIDCMDLPDGNHVIRVDAAAVKPIYCAVKIATNDPDAPWPYTLTEHETEDEARQAMKETSDD